MWYDRLMKISMISRRLAGERIDIVHDRLVEKRMCHVDQCTELYLYAYLCLSLYMTLILKSFEARENMVMYEPWVIVNYFALQKMYTGHD